MHKMDRILYFLFRLLPAICCVAPAADDAETMAKLKAAIIFQFSHYVEMKNTDSKTYEIVVSGDEQLLVELKKITSGKEINGIPYEVRGINSASKSKANVFYVSSENEKQNLELLNNLANCGCLIIVNNEKMIARGGVIHLSSEEDKVNFSISLSQAKKQNLTMKAQLLKLGKVIP